MTCFLLFFWFMAILLWMGLPPKIWGCFWPFAFLGALGLLAIRNRTRASLFGDDRLVYEREWEIPDQAFALAEGKIAGADLVDREKERENLGLELRMRLAGVYCAWTMVLLGVVAVVRGGCDLRSGVQLFATGSVLLITLFYLIRWYYRDSYWELLPLLDVERRGALELEPRPKAREKALFCSQFQSPVHMQMACKLLELLPEPFFLRPGDSMLLAFGSAFPSLWYGIRKRWGIDVSGWTVAEFLDELIQRQPDALRDALRFENRVERSCRRIKSPLLCEAARWNAAGDSKALGRALQQERRLRTPVSLAEFSSFWQTPDDALAALRVLRVVEEEMGEPGKKAYYPDDPFRLLWWRRGVDDCDLWPGLEKEFGIALIDCEVKRLCNYETSFEEAVHIFCRKGEGERRSPEYSSTLLRARNYAVESKWYKLDCELCAERSVRPPLVEAVFREYWRDPADADAALKLIEIAHEQLEMPKNIMYYPNDPFPLIWWQTGYSMDDVEFVMAVEQEFHVALNDRESEKLFEFQTTLADVVKRVRSKDEVAK